MFAYPLRTAALAMAAAVGLSACTTGYGYNGVSVGVGNGYYDPYYSGYGYGAGYPGYGYGYGYAPYYGWYDGYYYPGTGYYVYDRYQRPYPWDNYKDYWEGRRRNAMSSSEFRRQMEQQRVQMDQPNWSGFGQSATQTQRVRQSDGRATRAERIRTQRTERSSRSDSNRSSRASSSSQSDRQSASDFRRANEANRDR